MERFRRLAVLTLAILAASSTAFAGAESSQTTGPRWACWYESNDLTVQCKLSRIPGSGSEAQAAEIEKSIDPRLPVLAAKLWGRPEQLADKQIGIPLWNVPFEMDFVRELAESVMCGLRADCSVLFDANHDGKAPLRVAALRAGANEDEVMAEATLQTVLAEAETVVSIPAKRQRRASRNG